MYSKQVLEHFQNPKNQGSLSDPDSLAQVGNPTCGDIMKLYLKIKDQKIEDIKFETLGCGAAIACSSVVTEEAKGMSLEDAKKINKEII